MQALGPAVFLNEPLRAQCVTNQDPFAAKWERLHSADTATTVCFDPRGVFLAIGTIHGEVIIWDVASARTVVACLRIPRELPGARNCSPALGVGPQIGKIAQEGAAANSLVRPTLSIAALAWSASAHLVFGATYSGLLVVWQAQTGAVLRAVSLPALMPGSTFSAPASAGDPPSWIAGSSIRGLRPHPLLPHLLLVVPGEGMPLLLDWVTGRGWVIPDAVLPPTRARASKAMPPMPAVFGAAPSAGTRFAAASGASAGAGAGVPAGMGAFLHGFNSAGATLGAAAHAAPAAPAATRQQLRCDAAWHGAHGAYFYLATARSGAGSTTEVSKLAFGAVVVGLRAMQAWLRSQQAGNSMSARSAETAAPGVAACAAASASASAAEHVLSWERALEDAYACVDAFAASSGSSSGAASGRPKAPTAAAGGAAAAGSSSGSSASSVGAAASHEWWPPAHAVYRVASVAGPPPLPLPELSHCARIGSLVITSRQGVMLLHDSDLTVRERGYAEGVEATPLTSARLAVGARLIVALAGASHGGARSHKQGGLYCFHRGKPGGSLRWRAPPKDSDGIVVFDAAPRLGMLACIGSRGAVWFTAPEPKAHFPGTMFPPGFVMMMANKEYAEAEDEFDCEWMQ